MATILKQLLKELQGQKVVTPSTDLMYGPGGIFSAYGVERDIFSTRIKPTGLLEVLPAYPTVLDTPLFEFITGFRSDTGSEQSATCGDCKTAGVVKGCTITAQFGRYCRTTKGLDLSTAGLKRDRSEPTDLRLLNPLLTPNRLSPSIGVTDPFQAEMAMAMVELGVSFEVLLGQQVWTGNPANSNAAGYMEFPGLEILVTTGHVDALTNTSCPSLDSDIKDFAYQDVASDAGNIVEVLSYMYRYVSKNGRAMEMDPVDFRFVMREELFYELTAVWPCSYMTYRCNVNGNTDALPQMDASAAIQFRDAMRNGRYLTVDGKQVPVVLDDGIPEDTNTNNANLAAGEFSSDIYLLPFSVRGNFASLYLEYQDFTKVDPDRVLAKNTDNIWWTDSGKFLWTRENTKWCVNLTSLIKPRILLRTPHLAGRLQNVKYEPLQHTRQPFPNDGYFVNGGVYASRTDRTLYHEWSDRGQG